MNNLKTYRTRYGDVTLLKNEKYIGGEFDRCYYWDEVSLINLRKYIDPSKDILVIGGHCGTSSLVYASFINTDSKVYVYEPQEIIFKILLLNIKQNQLEDKIIPINKGVFCYNGIGNMHNIDLDGGGGIISNRYTEENYLPCNFGGITLGKKGEPIMLTTIDDIQYENLGFIHCHAQGSENFIFSKSLETINKHKPVILYSNNELYGTYLYDNVCNNYSEYIDEGKFDIKKYCIENLGYSFIDKFNGSKDILLIPPQDNYTKTIYITNKQIDSKLLLVQKQWLELNPNYKVELYDDSRCLDMLQKYYGIKYYDIFNYIPDGPIKSDFFRVCLIYALGGIYVDADIKPIVPFDYYIDDDVDFMTCISYNYSNTNNNFAYNPHFIVSKKFSPELLEVIYKYEKIYDNRLNNQYSYWSWSICNLFNKISNFEINVDDDNTFIYKNKKYKFIIEEISVDNETKYNYSNISILFDKQKQVNKKYVYCKYKDTIVFTNHDNK